MPNWCYNTLEVRGQPEDVLKFFEHAKSERMEKHIKTYNPLVVEEVLVKRELDFNKFIEMPEELRNTENAYGGTEEEQAERLKKYEANKAKYGYPTWYEWANSNWDTKWNACEVTSELNTHYKEDEHCIDYYFETAWSPPMNVFHKMAEMFPKLKFYATYKEEGQGFHGHAGWKNGVCVKCEDINMNSNFLDEEEES